MAAGMSLLRQGLGVLHVLPTLWRVKRLLSTQGDLSRILTQLDARADVSPAARINVMALEQDVNRALRLVGPRTRACVPRSLTLYALLSRQGLPVTYVSGVRLNQGVLDGHAWLEVPGQILESGGQSESTYKVQFKHPNRRAMRQAR